jgi:hypothetical protein
VFKIALRKLPDANLFELAFRFLGAVGRKLLDEDENCQNFFLRAGNFPRGTSSEETVFLLTAFTSHRVNEH